jgi:carboxyl-terminal processing protease
MARYNRKIINNEIKNSDKKNRFSPSVLFILLAIMAAIGYTAGFYHYQIEAALGPIFGYKAHSGDINLNSLRETYNTLAANYDGKIDQAALIEGANRGMVDAVDDEYTVYMNAQEASDYGDSLSGNIGAGIGAEINVKNGKVTIVRTLKDNAAINAGLKADDIILKINDQSTDGWSSEKAVSQIKGEEGTTVKLTIQRGNTIKEYVITRAIINNPSVESSMDGNLGVITISRFDTETGNLAKKPLRDLRTREARALYLICEITEVVMSALLLQ